MLVRETAGRAVLVTGSTPSRNFCCLPAVGLSTPPQGIRVTQLVSTAALFTTLYAAVLLMKLG